MTTDPGTTVPDERPSVSIVDTAWGTVVRTRTALGIAGAVMLRRVAQRYPDGVVLLDVRATSVAEPIVEAAVADLATGLRSRGGVLLVERSPDTSDALVAAAGAPVYTSLIEAFGGRRSSPSGAPSPDSPAPARPVRMPRARGPECG